MQFNRPKPRDFMTLVAGAAVAWPLAARAQQADRMRRLGVLMTIAENDAEGKKYIASFVQGLHDLGWTEGGNISYRVSLGGHGCRPHSRRCGRTP